MFNTVRIRLITCVVGVLAVVLLAAGGAVYVVLSRQLDAAVSAELRVAAARYSNGVFTISRLPDPLSVPGSDVAISGSGAALPEDPSSGPQTGAARSQQVLIGSGPQLIPPADQSSDGTFAVQWIDGQAITRLGAVPAGLPDQAAIAAAKPESDAFSTISAGGQRYRLLTRVLPAPPGVPRAVVQSGISLAGRDREQRTVLLALAGGGALGLVLTLAGALFLTGRTLAPVELAFDRQRRFIGDASHELRTPLTLLRLEVESLGERPDGGSTRSLLRGLDRTARLVDDLLMLAQIDEGALPFEPEPVHVATLVEAAGAAARSLAPPDVAISHSASADLWVNGDRDRLYRVLLILVDNACRAVSAGGSVGVSACAGGESVVLQVTDTGRGIPPEQLERVFERFHRVDRARTRAAGGAGLGLSIAREIVRACGGTITLESTLGEGTTVTVRLHRLPAPASVEAGAVVAV